MVKLLELWSEQLMRLTSSMVCILNSLCMWFKNFYGVNDFEISNVR